MGRWEVGRIRMGRIFQGWFDILFGSDGIQNIQNRNKWFMFQKSHPQKKEPTKSSNSNPPNINFQVQSVCF